MNYLDNIRNAKVLVSGGLGFVGHNLVRSLVQDYGCAVIVLDNCHNSSKEVLGDILQKVELRVEDVRNIDAVVDACKGVDYFFHLACIQIAESSSNPVVDMEVNALSTLNILEKMRSGDIKLKRLVYTSSASIYGSSTIIPVPEDAPKNVLSNYAATKLLGENYTMIYGKNYNLPVAAVRYSNIYGYGQSPLNPYCGVLGKFIHNAKHSLPLTVIGDGEQTRDYTFITDAVHATILAGAHPKADGDAFNVGTGREVSVNDLVTIVKELCQDISVERILERDIDNIRRRSVDIEHIRQRLGWVPQVTLREGVEKTLTAYQW